MYYQGNVNRVSRALPACGFHPGSLCCKNCRFTRAFLGRQILGLRAPSQLRGAPPPHRPQAQLLLPSLPPLGCHPFPLVGVLVLRTLLSGFNVTIVIRATVRGRLRLSRSDGSRAAPNLPPKVPPEVRPQAVLLFLIVPDPMVPAELPPRVHWRMLENMGVA